MKKMLLIPTLLLALALMLSACTLPFPGGAPAATEDVANAETDPLTEPTATPLTDVATQIPEETKAPPAVTNTPIPTVEVLEPSSTPVTPDVVITEITAPQAVRIQFKPGTTSGTVEGELNAGQTSFYVLGANAGQTMTVIVWSPNNDVYLTVSGVSTGTALVQASEKLTSWTAPLAATQDYYLSVTASGGRTSFSITIDLPISVAGSTPIPAGLMDPYVVLGTPDHEDTATGDTLTDWASPGADALPDDSYIRLQFKDAKLYVTGKQLGFSTWWFTWHALSDFYLEMTFNTKDCSGKDAYGTIIRGPDHDAGVSYGYVVAFSCDGSYWIFRLDGIDPWDAENLVAWSESDYIITGSDKTNVMGIQAVGDTITVYANGHQIAEVVDDEYSGGRFGVFVSPASTANFTYRLIKIAYWDLKGE